MMPGYPNAFIVLADKMVEFHFAPRMPDRIKSGEGLTYRTNEDILFRRSGKSWRLQ